jgi:hypothetical protein
MKVVARERLELDRGLDTFNEAKRRQGGKRHFIMGRRGMHLNEMGGLHPHGAYFFIWGLFRRGASSSRRA